jgi:hypothetical protein
MQSVKSEEKTMTKTCSGGVPQKPVQGLVFWVQEGSHWSFGDAFTVGKVNGRSFYVYTHGRSERFLTKEWGWWLDQRFAEGTVFCNGRQLVKPGDSPVTAQVTAEAFSVDLPGRDQRFLRAARDILTTYDMARNDASDGFVEVSVQKGRRRYTVTARPDWSTPPKCTCPDATTGARRLTGGFCKHAMAVCITYDDLRCQLLDLLV